MGARYNMYNRHIHLLQPLLLCLLLISGQAGLAPTFHVGNNNCVLEFRIATIKGLGLWSYAFSQVWITENTYFILPPPGGWTFQSLSVKCETPVAVYFPIPSWYFTIVLPSFWSCQVSTMGFHIYFTFLKGVIFFSVSHLIRDRLFPSSERSGLFTFHIR